MRRRLLSHEFAVLFDERTSGDPRHCKLRANMCAACQNLAATARCSTVSISICSTSSSATIRAPPIRSPTTSASPSAIARRLRRLRGEGWIARTIALLAERLTEHRLRALVFIQLDEHADHPGQGRARAAACARPTKSSSATRRPASTCSRCSTARAWPSSTRSADAVLVADPTVRRYETSFVKREVKFAPFVELGG